MKVLSKMNKKAKISEALLNIYRMLLVLLIAFVILGVAAIFYEYYLDVRNVESEILVRDVMNCINTPDFNLDALSVDQSFAILNYCGIRSDVNRLYVQVVIYNSSGDTIKKLEQGDSGLLWVKEIIEAVPPARTTTLTFTPVGLSASKGETKGGGDSGFGFSVSGGVPSVTYTRSEDLTKLEKYKPGYFARDYPVTLVYNNQTIRATLYIQGVVGHEF